MKLKKSSFFSMVLAFVLVATLSIGTLTLFAESPHASQVNAPSEAVLERLAAIMEEAGVVIMPYELRGRLPVPDEDAIQLFTDLEPEIRAWINEQVQAGVPFLLDYPTALLYEPEVYALVMGGASWSEVMNFVRERALERFEREGHTVFRMEDSRYFELLPPSTDLTGELPRFIPADDLVGFDFEEIFANINRYGLRVIDLDEMDINIIPRFVLDPSEFEGAVRILPRN